MQVFLTENDRILQEVVSPAKPTARRRFLDPIDAVGNGYTDYKLIFCGSKARSVR